MGFILQLLPLFVVVAIGFACGYGVCEWIARRRLAAAREKIHQENPEWEQLEGDERSTVMYPRRIGIK